MRRKRGLPLPMIIVGLSVIAIVVFFISLFNSSPEKEAAGVVNEFYKYEQDADFGSSWELFHPQMKKKFNKSDYIQQRNHVFVGHFGTDTFKYTVGDAEKLDSWKMSKDTTSLYDVYKVPITQTYKSTFGTFTMNQDIFVTKHKGDWTILWTYQ